MFKFTPQKISSFALNIGQTKSSSTMEPQSADMYICTSDRAKLYMKSTGKGKTVLFLPELHNEMSSFFPFWKNVKATHHRIISFDWRGCGKSTLGTKENSPQRLALDLLEVFEELDLQDVIVVCHPESALLLMQTAQANTSFSTKIQQIIVTAQTEDKKFLSFLGIYQLKSHLFSRAPHQTIEKLIESMITSNSKNLDTIKNFLLSFLPKNDAKNTQVTFFQMKDYLHILSSNSIPLVVVSRFAIQQPKKWQELFQFKNNELLPAHP